MGAAREIVALERMLREQNLDVFLPLEQSGLLNSAAAAQLAQSLEVGARGDSWHTLRLVLQALRVQHDDLRPTIIDAELVASLPASVPGMVRPTRSVVHQMIDSAEAEIIMLGYQLKDSVIIDRLVKAGARNVNVIVICDRGEDAVPKPVIKRLQSTQGLRVFYSTDWKGRTKYGSMHAKCLLIDCKELLITSANFTFHGMDGNIEIGIRLVGEPAVEARKIFGHLVTSALVAEVGQ